MNLHYKNIWKNIKAFCFGIFIGLLVCEVILRIYNPFPFTIKKGRLLLPANQAKTFTNNWIHKLEPTIHYSRNSLGFRGPELPDSISRLISILTIGGSTTECKFQSDSITWSFLLYDSLKKSNDSIWLNNAGIDGHSTFGNLLLLNEYVVKLKPNYAIFLTGINDEELQDPDEFDLMSKNKITTSSWAGFFKSVLNQTELGRTVFNFYHVQIAYRKGLIHRDISIPGLVDNPLSEDVISRRIKNQNQYLKAYHERIDQIVHLCQTAGIEPILLTQPSLFGSFTDSATKVAMGNKWLNNKDQDNCMLEGKVLEMYNDVLRSYAGKMIVIDMAREMPKNSAYYYDFIHYTNEGARKMASILFTQLKPIILRRKTK